MQLTFFGFEAHIGRVDGERRVSIWTEDPRVSGFDVARLVPIDLSKTPYAARVNAIEWDEVQVDDCATPGGWTWPIPPEPGFTSLDPKYPFVRTRGSVWLEARYVQSLRNMGYALPSPHVPVGARDYEFTTVLDVQLKPGGAADVVRYNPYHGRIEPDGSVTLWERGQSGNPNPNPPCTKVPFTHLQQPHNCHQQLGTLLAKKSNEGSVFLTASSAKMMPMNGPKMPHIEGI